MDRSAPKLKSTVPLSSTIHTHKSKMNGWSELASEPHQNSAALEGTMFESMKMQQGLIRITRQIATSKNASYFHPFLSGVKARSCNIHALHDGCGRCYW